MKNLKSIIWQAVFFVLSCGIINAQEVSLDIVESTNGCGLATDCAADFICFDIRMTVDIDKDLDSYNIWVQFDNSVLSRINGGDDNSCVVNNGQDTNIEDVAGAYRVAGIPGSAFPMTANTQEIVHTICFSIMDTEAVNGTTLSVGGSLFGGALPTSITFADGSTDAVEEVMPLVISDATVSCFILPVNILYFDVKKLKPRKSLLEWITLSEVNNDHFEIQRSSNGIDFTTIGTVNGMGNTSQETKYAFTDETPKRSNYYRLRQVDFDGNFEYSDLRFISFDKENDSKFLVTPNPFSNQLTLKLNDGIYKVSLYDIHGKLVFSTFYLNGQDINLPGLPAGAYIIKVDDSLGKNVLDQIIIRR